jgi:hypothetical protein
MTEREPTKEEIKELINGVFFVLQPATELCRVETTRGTAVQLIVTNQRLGSSHHLFFLEPIAEELLRRLPHKDARALLSIVLSKLHLGFSTALANVLDSAGLEMNEMLKASDRINLKKKRPTSEELNERRRAALKRMDARNRSLVGPRPKAITSVESLSMAVGHLRANGTPKERITVGSLALLLGCEDAAVYKAFERKGISLKQLLDTVP